MRKYSLIGLILLLVGSYVYSSVPCKINYQGRLIKDNVPVNGTKKMVFSIHDSAVGGDELWTSGEVDVTVHNGLFRYVLDLSSIDDWTAGETLYLEVKVGPDILTPREELYAYPYAINSHLLEGRTKEYFINTSGETQRKDGGLNIMGNVGIGTTSPGYKLDVAGDVRLTGNLLYGDSATRTYSRDNIGLQGDAGAKSGFYQTSAPAPAANWYPGASSWQHYIDVRHSNPANNYALQIAGSFYNQELYFRKTIGSPTTGWNKFVYQNSSGNVGIGTTSPGAKLEVAGNFRATGGIEPDWDSGWVKVDRINSWGLKTWTHNLNCFPRQIQWWYSTSNPGSWVGPVAWSKEDHWSSPIGVWITQTEIKFTIWHDRCVYRGFNGSSWQNYNSGYYRILLWK